MPVPIWIDCDTGHDDAFGLILGASLPQANLLGVSTIGGNQTLEKTTINSLNILNVLQKFNIPVVKGTEHALLNPNVECPEIHGESGLDTKNKDFIWPPLKIHAKNDVAAMQYLAEMLLARDEDDEKVHIIATGRLTNIALLFVMYPRCIRFIAQITIMGGSFRAGGNTGRTAEFNIQLDPEAAQIVMNHGCTEAEMVLLQTTQKLPKDTTLYKLPIVLIPLDITHHVIVTDDILARLKQTCPSQTSIGKMTTFGQMCHDLLLFFSESYKTLFKFSNGPPLHDPVAVFYALAVQHNICNETQLHRNPSQILEPNTILPPLFETVHTRVDIETAMGHCRGTTAVDLYGLDKKPNNCILGLRVDVDAFWNYMFEAIKLADQNSIFNDN